MFCSKPQFEPVLVVLVLMAAMSNLSGAERPLDNRLRLKIAEVNVSTLAIDVRNPSDKSVRIWKKSNSWGAACWRLVIVRGEETLILYQNPDQFFTKNNPGYDEIAANGMIRVALDPNDGSWLGTIPKRITFNKSDILIVLYDVPSSREAQELNVWYGVVAAHSVVE